MVKFLKSNCICPSSYNHWMPKVNSNPLQHPMQAKWLPSATSTSKAVEYCTPHPSRCWARCWLMKLCMFHCRSKSTPANAWSIHPITWSAVKPCPRERESKSQLIHSLPPFPHHFRPLVLLQVTRVRFSYIGSQERTFHHKKRKAPSPFGLHLRPISSHLKCQHDLQV